MGFPAAVPATRRASVRARYMQTFAAHVEKLTPRERTLVHAAVPDETWRAIESSGPLGWLPIDVNLACTRAVAGTLGTERTHHFFRGLLRGTTETPLLSGLVQSVLRIAVRDPGLYLPWIGKGYDVMFRDTGRYVVLERRPGRAVSGLRDLPAECVVDDVWARSVASALHALFDLIQLDGSVEVAEVDEGERSVTFHGKWATR